MKNNKIDVAATIEIVKTEISDDPGTVKIATEITTECAEVTGETIYGIRKKRKRINNYFICAFLTDEDRCEATYKIIICIEEAAKARGLTLDR